jgi:hypothetical protein
MQPDQVGCGLLILVLFAAAHLTSNSLSRTNKSRTWTEGTKKRLQTQEGVRCQTCFQSSSSRQVPRRSCSHFWPDAQRCRR